MITAFIVAAAIAAGVLGLGGTWLILRREDTRPLNVPGRDAPARPATTGPAAADPQWWLKGEPGIPAGGSSWDDPRCDTACPQWLTGECDTLCDPRLSPPIDVPPGDTAVPAPASLPEGDEPAARPPQEAPAREPSPLAKAIAANAALQAIPLSDYLDEVDTATAYDGDAPWNPFSDVTLTRIQAIRDGAV